MNRPTRIPLFDLIISISDAMDLLSPVVVDHHLQVAYIASAIADELDLEPDHRNAVFLAAALHDIGAFSAKERRDTLDFELIRPHRHAWIGHQLLTAFQPFAEAAEFVKHHHVPWADGGGREFGGEEVALGSHIIHLADRVAVLLERGEAILTQTQSIRKKIREKTGVMFMPELVEAFDSIAGKEFFWLDLGSPSVAPVLRSRTCLEPVELDGRGLEDLGNLFRTIIDFRSHYTATHCSGVVATAEELARLHGFSENECRMMRVAGCLHDLGKLGIPLEILEKPARLEAGEFAVMQWHVYHTFRILEPIEGLGDVRAWASFHQERMNGTGYPFHLTGDDLPLGSRIMAVADVFTALTEDRPYRKGMSPDEAKGILDGMVRGGEMDPRVTGILGQHFRDLDGIRADAQREASRQYEEFLRAVP